MKYTRSDIINALVNEWDYLCLEEPDEQDLTSEEYRESLQDLTLEELIEEADIDPDEFPSSIEDYMECYGSSK